MLSGKKYELADIAGILRRRAWFILVPLAVVSAATAVAARWLPDRYLSETLILVVPQRIPDSYVKPTVTARIEDRLESITQQILSRTRLERIIQDFNLYPEERSRRIMEDIVEQMRSDITVQVVKGDAFRVTYAGANARTVMKVTERLASLFIEENLRDREVLAEGTSQFLEAQLEDARRRLVEQEKKVEKYRQRYAGQLPSQLQSNLQVIQNTQMQIQALIESLNRDRERRLVVQRTLADLSIPAQAVQPPGARRTGRGADDDADGALDAATAAGQLEEARAMLRALQLRLKPAHPDVVRMQILVADLQRKADAEAQAAPSRPVQADAAPATRDLLVDNRMKELRLELDQLDLSITRKEQQEKDLRAAVGEYQRRVEAVPSRESEMAELTRDYATLQSMYTTLLTKREDSKIAANLERRQIGEQFKLLDPARLPEKPYRPNRPLIDLFGVAAGLCLGAGLAAFLEYRDSSFASDREVNQALAIPVLAVVPVLRSAADRRRALIRQLTITCALGTLVVAGLATFVYAFLR